MRRALILLATLGLLLGSTPIGSSTATAGPTTGGFASDNVAHVRHIPLNIDSAGARVVGDYFYITTSNGLMIWDASDPLNPTPTGYLPLPQQPYFAEEDVDTNGEILLVSTLTMLFVVDVEDKSAPTIVGQLAGADQHTWTCVLDCTWAYGSEGLIADLRDPTAPALAGTWTEGNPASGSHDVTEVKRGIIVTSSTPIMMLDARKNPAKPKLLAVGQPPNGQYMHSNIWPRLTKDRWLIMGSESSGPSCDENDGGLMIFDTSKLKKTRTFQLVDEYKVENGLPTDGNAAANLYCGHWIEARPGWKNGGYLAMGWYEHGSRFFEVDGKGKISEAGYFLPYAGSTTAAYWMSKDIVYAVDYNRGLDILKFEPAS